MTDEVEDEDIGVLEAKLVLQKLMGDTKVAAEIVLAVEALIEMKMAVMVEQMADRVEDALGARP